MKSAFLQERMRHHQLYTVPRHTWIYHKEEITRTLCCMYRDGCRIWSRGRHYSPSLPGDWYLKRCLQKRSQDRNLWELRSVPRSVNTSRGNVLLVFCWRMRSFSRTAVLTIFLGKKYRRRVK